MKKFLILTILTAGIIACGSDDNGNNGEYPKQQTTELTNLFNEGLTATVTGYLTDTEWAGVADKIEDAINGKYKAHEGADIFQSIYEDVFGRGIIITVKKNPEFDNWKTTGDGVSLYLNIDALNDLQSKLDAIVLGSLRNNGEAMAKMLTPDTCSDPTIGKIITPEAFTHSIVTKLKNKQIVNNIILNLI